MKIVFTWGTHVWKTTILNLFKDNKKIVINKEVVRENMNMLIDLLWIEKYQDWRINHFLEFQTMNIISSIKRDINLNNNKINLLDRWVFDFIASLKRENINIPDSLLELVKNINYDLILFFEPIEQHKIREKTWRMLNKEKSELWAKYIYNEYINIFWNSKVIKVPFFNEWNIKNNIEERYNFILSILKKYIIK